MKLIVNCPESEIDSYLETIKTDLSQGLISRHSSRIKNWKIIEGESNE